MWFESLEAMGASYSAPDYLERARPDEQRFADFNSALVYVCEEHELKRQVDSIAPAADLPSQGLDTTAGVDGFRFACISDARLFADQFLGCGEQHAKRGETHGVNISGAFLAHTHLVFSCD
jgi:hypothetical protein